MLLKIVGTSFELKLLLKYISNVAFEGRQLATCQVKAGKRKVGNENGDWRFEYDTRSSQQT